MIFFRRLSVFMVPLLFSALCYAESNLQTYDSQDIGEYNFISVANGLWDCSQVGYPDSNEALLAVGPDAIGLYLADEAITFEGFKFTSAVFRRNYYVTALNNKWIAFHEDGQGKAAELEFSYEFSVLTKRVSQAGATDTSNYLCRKKGSN